MTAAFQAVYPGSRTKTGFLTFIKLCLTKLPASAYTFLEYHKMSEEKVISYCGICCSLCPANRAKECLGCPELEDCRIIKCAQSKNIRYCFLCKEFPCKIFEDGFDWNLDEIPNLKKYKLGTVKWKPYSREYIELFKLNNIKPFIKKPKTN